MLNWIQRDFDAPLEVSGLYAEGLSVTHHRINTFVHAIREKSVCYVNPNATHKINVLQIFSLPDNDLAVNGYYSRDYFGNVRQNRAEIKPFQERLSAAGFKIISTNYGYFTIIVKNAEEISKLFDVINEFDAISEFTRNEILEKIGLKKTEAMLAEEVSLACEEGKFSEAIALA